ncbi:glycine--tRNA ligase [Candidatus Woesearchaeota archaeon]|nr:glycine--tRNA ligase [Nanoarchaeota archaeon]MCB9370302.1 glycine--tRNA ligase [Candidatus Woesearchaeota archaeon]USN44826.1 MAG: glycine--tRNA ligase [Candidatus Woesearchaeota archaeon]
MENKLSMEEFSKFLKAKGFIYQSSEIYGGLSGLYDYGHNGTALKNNWCKEWRKFFLKLGSNFVEIDASIIMHEHVFKASGHLENFFDPIVVIEGEDQTYRADHLIEDKLNEKAEELTNEEMLKKIVENKLLGDIDYSKVKVENLNMMFPVDMGPKRATKAYLRPETAQSPYVNFKIQFELQRKKLPLGLGMIGRVYRNEISPRNLTLRTRELEQAELQIFFNPSKIDEHEGYEAVKNSKLKVLLKDKRDQEPEYLSLEELRSYGLPRFYLYHMLKVQQFHLEIMKLDEKNFRFLELNDKEKAFYNKYHFDIEVKMNNPASWVEVGGVHYRTDHDLKGHEEISRIKMEVLDDMTGERFIPHVLELSLGLGRQLYTLLDQKLSSEEERGNAVYGFPKKLAPNFVAVFPLMKRDSLPEYAKKIVEELEEEDLKVFYDEAGSVGKRYARQDEIGTPYCITVDYETLEEGENKNTVTIRDRDTTKQKRVQTEKLVSLLKDLQKEKVSFDDL